MIPTKTNPFRKALGERLLRARLEMGARARPPRSVSQTEIGNAIGLTGVAVGSWEAGRKVPDLETVQRLARLLGVRPAWLAFGEEPMMSAQNGSDPATYPVQYAPPSLPIPEPQKGKKRRRA